MSVKVLSTFMLESRSALGARIVGMVLSDSAWDDGISWLPVDQIALRANLSERQVYRCLTELEQLGELEKRKAQRGRRRLNVYRMRLGASVPQYEHLPIDLGDPFSDDLPNCQVVAGSGPRPDTHVNDDLTPKSGRHLKEARKGSRKPLATASDEASASRPRDLIWDALEERFGAVAPKTNAHARRNKAVGDLRKLEADPASIRRACSAWGRLFPGAVLTDIALATHYPQLVRSPAARPLAAVQPEPLPQELSDEDRAANAQRLRSLAGGRSS